MYNNITIKLSVRISLKSEDIVEVLDNSCGRRRLPVFPGSNPVDYIISNDKVVSEVTLPFNFECDEPLKMADDYAQFIGNILCTEGVYRISCFVGDQNLADFSYIALWDDGQITVKFTHYHHTIDVIDEIYELWQNLDDKVNSHYTSLFQDYPDYHEKLVGKQNE